MSQTQVLALVGRLLGTGQRAVAALNISVPMVPELRWLMIPER